MCEACDEAQKNPHTGLTNAGCKDCQVRAIAQSIPFYQSEQAGRLTAEYKRVMALTFGDQWTAAHELVKAFREQLSKDADVKRS